MPKLKKQDGGETKTRKKKDPDAPKRPSAAYMFFCKEMREKIKEESPDCSFGEIGKLLGQKWAEADAAARKKYTAMAEKDKLRYDAVMKEYKP
eukprot:6693975-Pyramimonas_sp.AAC.1